MANIQSGQTYKLVNAKAGTCIDLSGGDNRSIIGYEYHGGGNQNWQVQQTGSGWTLRALGSGQYLGIDGPADNGTSVVAVNEPFEWDIWPDEDDSSTFRLFVPNTRQNLDLSDHGNPTPGTPVTLWDKWNGENQKWRFEPAQ